MTKYLKKGMVVCLAGAIMISAAACGSSNSDKGTAQTKTSTTSTQQKDETKK